MNARKTLRGSSGFTLAELLIVMAIVLVLAALAIPSFTKNLEQSRETTDISAVRAAYSEVISSAMLGSADLKQGDGTYQAVVSPLKQLSDGWNLEVTNMDIAGINGADWQGTPKAGGKCTVKYDPTTDKCTIIWGDGDAGGGGGGGEDPGPGPSDPAVDPPAPGPTPAEVAAAANATSSTALHDSVLPILNANSQGNASATITIKDGKIFSVKVNKNGNGGKSAAELEAMIRSAVSGISFDTNDPEYAVGTTKTFTFRHNH